MHKPCKPCTKFLYQILCFGRKVSFFPASKASTSIFPQPSGSSLFHLFPSLTRSLYPFLQYLFLQLGFSICRDGKSNKRGIGKRGLGMCSRNLHLFVGFVIYILGFNLRVLRWMKKVRKGNVNNKNVGSWCLTQVSNHARKILSCSSLLCIYVVDAADYDNLLV
ncbi:unnamed protein product [Malus baccata var. baccata]